MGTAICKGCSKKVHFQGTKGFRLADHQCVCGSGFGLARWNDQRNDYELIERSGKRGKRVQCDICDRKFYPHLHDQRLQPGVVSLIAERKSKYQMKVLISSDDNICQYHTFQDRIHAIDFDRDTYYWLNNVTFYFPVD